MQFLELQPFADKDQLELPDPPRTPVLQYLHYENFIHPPIEPILSSQFFVTLPLYLNFPPAYSIRSVTRPYWVDGRWQPITVEFLDMANPPVSLMIRNLVDYFEEHNLPDNIPNNTPPLFIFMIEAVDGAGASLLQWTISVKNLQSVDWHRVTFDGDDAALSTVEMTFEVMTCELNN